MRTVTVTSIDLPLLSAPRTVARITRGFWPNLASETQSERLFCATEHSLPIFRATALGMVPTSSQLSTDRLVPMGQLLQLLLVAPRRSIALATCIFAMLGIRANVGRHNHGQLRIPHLHAAPRVTLRADHAPRVIDCHD